jgi:hypothetical protein
MHYELHPSTLLLNASYVLLRSAPYQSYLFDFANMFPQVINLSIVVKLPNVDLHLMLIARSSSSTQAISISRDSRHHKLATNLKR